MSARVKLLTPWDGAIPLWYVQFVEQMANSRLFKHELVQFVVPTGHVESMNDLAQIATGAPCRKATAYAQCDLRPLFGKMFANLIAGYEWWGWCDLDIVVGDLDRLLGPYLDDYDIVTTAVDYIHGPLTLIRNTPALRELYQNDGRWREVLADPDYCNFDETGFNDDARFRAGIWNPNPNFTRIVRDTESADGSTLLVRYDDRAWTETRSPLPPALTLGEKGIPSRGCVIQDGRLYETPTGRELLLYHFTSPPKRWPIPDPNFAYNNARIYYDPPPPEMSPNETPEFWDARVWDYRDGPETPVHTVVYNTDLANWARIQEHSAKVIRELVMPRSWVLDAGCGYGALVPVLTERDIYYEGVDYSPEMVRLARELHYHADPHGYPNIKFSLDDIRHLPHSDQRFNWVICRGLEGSTRAGAGNAVWNEMVTEMLRVSKEGVIVIDLDCNHRVIRKGDR